MVSIFRLGAVAYDPKVVTIWEGFKEYFKSKGFDFDYVLYSNYEAQVEAHLRGDFDVAWNSPLAWIETERALKGREGFACAVAMRDTDRDLSSVVVVRQDSPIQGLNELRGSVVAVGAPDSPQATLIPLVHLAEAGLEAGKDFQVRINDVLRGKHGDHIGGERRAARALMEGSVDAACMIDGNHLAFLNEGTLPAGGTRILARTERYDHCNFTVLVDPSNPSVKRFTELLFAMRYDDPQLRGLLDMEGLKKWELGRVSGYSLLNQAVDRFGTAFECNAP
jgi:phosphonate transport system substrate-binding protein